MIPRRRYEWSPGFLSIVASAARAGRLREGTDPRVVCAEIAAALGAGPQDDAVLTGSGRGAMLVALRALGLKAGDRVLVPGYTFAGVPRALSAAGLVPVLADVDENAALTPDTIAPILQRQPVQAVVFAHLFGRIADVGPIADYCRTRRVVLLEDCAHVAGARDDAGPVGHVGDAAFFSFDALKTIAALGGGLSIVRGGSGQRTVTAKTASRADLVARVGQAVAEALLFEGPASRAVGIVAKWVGSGSPPAGWSQLQSRLVTRQLATLDARLNARRAMARRVLGAAGIEDPQLAEDARTRGNAYFALVRTADRGERDAIVQMLRGRGIDVGVGRAIADALDADLPMAKTLSDTLIQVPVGARYIDAEIDEICAAMTTLRGRATGLGCGVSAWGRTRS